MSSARRAPAPPRGILRRAEPVGRMQHRRLLPCASLAPFIAHFWWVEWELSEPFMAETLPHPTVHLCFERGGDLVRNEVAGVPSGRFVRQLAGSGRVFGVKFRPGAFAPWFGGSVSTLTGRVVPLSDVFAARLSALEAAAPTWLTLEQAIAQAEPCLLENMPALSAEVSAARDLAERIERDRTLVRVQQLSELAGLDLRTLQRHFRKYVGVSPKWVLQRYRLHEAAERLLSPEPPALAELAAELGYVDQPHFVHDFRAAIGRAPGAFLRAHAVAKSSVL